MAVIAPAQVQVLYNQGGTDLIALMAVRNFQSGDTLDVATLGIGPAFSVVKMSVILSFVANKAALATAAGTVVTIPAGFPVNSTCYLLVGGCLCHSRSAAGFTITAARGILRGRYGRTMPLRAFVEGHGEDGEASASRAIRRARQ